MKLHLQAILFALSISNTLLAATEHEQHRELGQHQHGVARLNIVMDKQVLKLYLETPTINILGFEHAPHTQSEQQQLASALNKLKNTTNIVQFSGGDCKLSKLAITNPFEKQAHYEKLDTPSSEHNDFNVEYSFICNKPPLRKININMFDSFSGFTAIHAQWILNNQAGAATLDQQQYVIKVE
jgi:hypothetical protein